MTLRTNVRNEIQGQRPFVIRDPVHGYVLLANHEKPIISSPVVQRLRHVSQNGFMHLVYPEVRTSRFTHSLGAMHLVSRFFPAIVSHSSNAAIQSITTSFKDYLKEQRDKLDYFEWLTDDQALKAHRYLRKPCDGGDHKLTFAAIEAATRLAALFHDVGHLPFSHDLEPVAEDVLTRLKSNVNLTGAKLHEYIGRAVAEHYIEEVDTGESEVRMKALLKLAGDIICRRSKRPLVMWLHDLVDGEIDVDRADYLLRDGRALGFRFAEYDLGRLIDNCLVYREKSGNLAFAVDIRGLPALESYHLARAGIYQMAVRHRKVVEASLALQHISSAMTRNREYGALLHDVLEALDSKEKGSQLLEKMRFFDDVYWLSEIRRYYQDSIETMTALDKSACEAVLLRSSSLKNLWKYSGARDKLNPLVAHLSKEQLSALTQELTTKGILFRYHNEAHRSNMAIMVDGSTRELTPLSRLNDQLHAIWESQLHAHAYTYSENRTSSRDVLKIIRGHAKTRETNEVRVFNRKQSSITPVKRAARIASSKHKSRKARNRKRVLKTSNS